MKITELPIEERSIAGYMRAYSYQIEQQLEQLGIKLVVDENGDNNRYIIKTSERRTPANNLMRELSHNMQMLGQRYQEGLLTETLINYANNLACSPTNLNTLSLMLEVPVATLINTNN